MQLVQLLVVLLYAVAVQSLPLTDSLLGLNEVFWQSEITRIYIGRYLFSPSFLSFSSFLFLFLFLFPFPFLLFLCFSLLFISS